MEATRDSSAIPHTPDDARHFYDIANGQLGRQHESRSAISGKVGVLLGFEAVVLAQLLILLGSYDWHLSAIPLGALGVAWVLLAFAYFIKTWQGGPDIDKVVDGMDSGRSATETLLRAARAIRKVYNENEKKEGGVTLLVNCSIIALGIALLTAVVIMLRYPGPLGTS